MSAADAFVSRIRPALERCIARALPGGRLLRVVALRPDEAAAADTLKVQGYGVPLRLEAEDASGAARTLVFHTATSNAFGHDRRADRAAEMLLAYDTFNAIPGHVRALDVGVLREAEGLVSLHGAGEFYLLTEYADGVPYAEDLRRIVCAGRLGDEDLARADRLVDALVGLHAERRGDAQTYRRSVRDLVGGGEGIFGIVDGYPDDVPGAPADRLHSIAERCTAFRRRLRRHEDRCRRIHGDFHPFNVLIGKDGSPILLDASRGCAGDPADDVTCMAINYVFFALEHPEAWTGALSILWHRFWSRYLEATKDEALLHVAPPFLAWRGLVVANPVWYPAVGQRGRERMLELIESVLTEARFDPDAAERVFR